MVLKIPESDAGLQDLMDIDLEYENTEDCRSIVAESRTVSVQRIGEPESTAVGDLEVLEARWRFQVAEVSEVELKSYGIGVSVWNRVNHVWMLGARSTS